MSRFKNVAGALLIGGASVRMGQDKAQVDFFGETAASRLTRCLDSFCAEVVVVGGALPPGAVGRAVADPPGPRSALRGLVGALRAVTQEKVLVVATDYYGLRMELLLALLACPEANAVVPRDSEYSHPLCALYAREATLARAEEALAEGRLRVGALVESLSPYYLEGLDLERLDPKPSGLRNVNTAEELEALRAELGDGA